MTSPVILKESFFRRVSDSNIYSTVGPIRIDSFWKNTNNNQIQDDTDKNRDRYLYLHGSGRQLFWIEAVNGEICMRSIEITDLSPNERIFSLHIISESNRSNKNNKNNTNYDVIDEQEIHCFVSVEDTTNQNDMMKNRGNSDLNTDANYNDDNTINNILNGNINSYMDNESQYLNLKPTSNHKSSADSHSDDEDGGELYLEPITMMRTVSLRSEESHGREEIRVEESLAGLDHTTHEDDNKHNNNNVSSNNNNNNMINSSNVINNDGFSNTGAVVSDDLVDRQKSVSFSDRNPNPNLTSEVTDTTITPNLGSSHGNNIDSGDTDKDQDRENGGLGLGLDREKGVRFDDSIAVDTNHSETIIIITINITTTITTAIRIR